MEKYYWFTKNNQTFPALAREAWTLYSKQDGVFHGTTDGSLYVQAMRDNKVERFTTDENSHHKPEYIEEQEKKLKIALDEATQQEIERADKNDVPVNLDMQFGSTSEQRGREHVKKMFL